MSAQSKKSAFLLPICLFVLFAGNSIPAASGWNDFAHMTVAYVAYQKLTLHSKARVKTLLKLNPYYDFWNKQITRDCSPERRDLQIFMQAATWPDAIKNDVTYVADGSADGNRPQGAEAARNIGYSDHFMHKYWHFFDKPFSQDGTSNFAVAPAPNAVTQLAACRKVLSSGAGDELKSYDLVWLIHVTGDVHQPMHCATRVSKYSSAGDNGGNDVLVNYDRNFGYRLHGYWDGCLGAGGLPDVPEFAGGLTPAKKSLASDTSVLDWLNESFSLSQQKVYVYPIKWGNGPFDLTRQYRQDAVTLSKERVRLAGERLANILNKELK